MLAGSLGALLFLKKLHDEKHALKPCGLLQRNHWN